MSSLKLLFTSGLLRSNSFVIIVISVSTAFLYLFFSPAEMDSWQMENTSALLLSCGISATGMLPAYPSDVFPSAYSGTDISFF